MEQEDKPLSSRELMIAEEIRKNKELRRRKYTNSGSFRQGQQPPIGAGRPKGAKNKRKYKLQKEVRYQFEALALDLLLSIKEVGIKNMSQPQKFDALGKVAKYVIPEKSSVDVKETQIKKIEVSFSDEFGTTNTIDITPFEEIDGGDVNE